MALLKIAGFDVYRFRIPFVSPIKVGNIVLYNREGFIVVLTDQQGRHGFGEIAPLPGWDYASLEQCRNDLSFLREIIGKDSFKTDYFNLTSSVFGLMTLPKAMNTHTLFGLESALLSLYVQEAPLNLPDPMNVPVNGLFIPDPKDEQASAQIQTLLARGLKTIKVKIGRLPEDVEMRQILRLADALGDNLRLRLDGNQSLSAQAYDRYFTALGHLNVEYAEEPLNEEASSTSSKVPWPLALDESLPRYLDPVYPDLSRLPSDIRTVILKPGLLAGLSGMAVFITNAKRRNIQTVLSSAFNTGIGIVILGVLSRLAGISPDTACGFDTLRYLQADVVTQSPVVSDGSLAISRSLFIDMSLNFGVLSREDL